ncbi:ATP-binding cassette domain-containing protein [Alkalimarinus alittae]|uniref:ATP-binding cassette domain-containing protein n=1 Tax=Alkalimarinus alittae TaxID=2961619 RepID=A0ABY6N2T8_9ALTE|nr:ATP-binding cassette domain-containing protein [Alkalimarinus alittae]UZE96428.1 ATP-binding cassette domain-containing protein [Alkalimarinus alittae]
MLNIEALSLLRGGNTLLDQVEVTIHTGRRVAIVGANGSGKTSLFKLILGELQADEGELTLPGQCRIAHMQQEVDNIDRTAIEHVIDGHKELRKLEAALAQAEAADDHGKMAQIHGQLDAIDGYNVNVSAEQLLHGLSFSQHDMHRPVSDFSGGWRIRLNLAQALMCPSDLLLLDEPTNHLDLDATLWLERWLKQYQGTLLFISHDRDFIDSVASHVLHFENKKLNYYTGSYSDFEKQRAERLAQQQANFEKQQQRISEIEDFVRRFRAKATKAKQAQSRLKELERMEKIAAAHIDSPFHFEFPCSEKMSDPLLNLKKISVGYGDKTILSDVTLSIHPGTRVGLLGPNGAGKSTLIKAFVNDLPPLAGERVCGEHLAIGYFAQHQLEALDPKASPATHIQRLSPKESEQSIRNFLGGFGFHGDEAFGDITTFSGGEKARLALAIIAWQKPNLLLLDEPTNHLDLEMRHALTMALQSFEGAVIVVSHDRHLLKNTVEEFLLVVDGKVDVFDGDLPAYEKWLLDYQKQSDQSTEKTVSNSDNESSDDKKERKRLAAENRKRISPLRKQLEKDEKSIDRLHQVLEEIEGLLADPDIYSDSQKDRLKQVLQQQAESKTELEEVELSWCDVSEQIETLQAEELE